MAFFPSAQSLELNTSVLRRACCTVSFFLPPFSLNSIKKTFLKLEGYFDFYSLWREKELYYNLSNGEPWQD